MVCFLNGLALKINGSAYFSLFYLDILDIDNSLVSLNDRGEETLYCHVLLKR